MVRRKISIDEFINAFQRTIELGAYKKYRDAELIAYCAYVEASSKRTVFGNNYTDRFALILKSGNKYIGMLNGTIVPLQEAYFFIKNSKLEKMNLSEIDDEKIMNEIVSTNI
jgi:hypothetical protein